MGIVFLIFWVLIPVVIALPAIKKWYLFDRHVKRANRLLEQGAIYEGLHLHYQIDNHQAITTYLVDKLALPTNYPDNFFLKKIVSFLSPDKLRPLIINTYKELAEIKIVASRANKRIPESLKSDVIQGANFATDALFEICDCLATVTRQNVNLKAIKDELQQEQEKLQQISKIVGETKQELAKLSFSHNRSDVSVDFTTSYFKGFVQTAKILREQNNLIKDKARPMLN